MNNHPNIFSLNTGGGKKVRSVLKDVWKYYIYSQCGLGKNLSDIVYYLFDEIRPKQNLCGDKNLVLIRNPLNVLNSIKRLDPHKYLNAHGVCKVFDGLLKIVRREEFWGIYLPNIVIYTTDSYKQICSFLGLEFDKRFASFDETFLSGLSVNNHKFIKKKIKDEQRFYDGTGIVRGHGGFNPALKLDIKRVNRPRTFVTKKEEKIIFKFMKNKYPEFLSLLGNEPLSINDVNGMFRNSL